MGNIKAVNDYFMIEIEKNPQGFIDTLNIKEEGIMSGRIVSISDEMTYYGMNTYAFDSSLMDKELLEKVYKHYKSYIGKRVYWPQRTESGAVIDIEGKQYVFIKMSALMAAEETE